MSLSADYQSLLSAEQIFSATLSLRRSPWPNNLLSQVKVLTRNRIIPKRAMLKIHVHLLGGMQPCPVPPRIETPLKTINGVCVFAYSHAPAVSVNFSRNSPDVCFCCCCSECCHILAWVARKKKKKTAPLAKLSLRHCGGGGREALAPRCRHQ